MKPMKLLLPLLAAVFLTLSFKAGAQTAPRQISKNDGPKLPFTIEGTLKNFPKKKAVVHVSWREPWEWRDFIKVDMVDGKFRASGLISQPTVARLRIVTYNDSMKPEQQFPWDCDMISFFISPGKTTVTGTDSLKTAVLKAGKENDLFLSVSLLMDSVVMEYDSIIAAWKDPKAIKDPCNIKTIDKLIWIAREKKLRKYEQLILQYPNSYVSIDLLNSYTYQSYDKHGWNMSRFLMNTLSSELQASPVAIAIKERIENALNPIVNRPMIPVVLKDTKGVKANISAYTGKIVLLDFWASWCGPCRKEFPELLTLYNKYKDQGFEILGISVDNYKPDWLQAIKEEKLQWPQFIDNPLKNATDTEAARLYRISAVPRKFLINPDGMVVATDLDIKQLENQIKLLLAKKKSSMVP